MHLQFLHVFMLESWLNWSPALVLTQLLCSLGISAWMDVNKMTENKASTPFDYSLLPSDENKAS